MTPEAARQQLDAEGVPLEKAQQAVDAVMQAIDACAGRTDFRVRLARMLAIPGLRSVLDAYGLYATQQALHDSAVPVCDPRNSAGRDESERDAGWDRDAHVTRLGPTGTA